jgi:hypothetical protein
MLRSTKTKSALAGLALAGGAAVAIATTATPALAFFSPPLLLQAQPISPATLVAKGAGVDVIVQVECAGSNNTTVNLTVTEKVGSKVASGGANAQVSCTGQTQNIAILVTADPSGKAFAKGKAIADAFISGCTDNFSFCGQDQSEPTIKLK